MRRAPTHLDVYAHNSPIPHETIPYAEGKIYVESGQADSINHGKSIRMRAPRNPEPSRLRNIEQNEQRGYSCRPGTGMHDRGARAIVLEREATR
jgi:hypothetical protein